MKILHTSDWHLGRSLDSYDLREAQSAAVTFIVDEAIKRAVDVLIIAGDVYDLGRPAVSEIKLLNSALTRLHDAGITVILTAGNHDEAERLAANSNLLRDKIHIWGSIEDSGKSIVITDEHGPVAFYPLTYLYVYKSQELFNKKGASLEKASHQAVLSQAMQYIRQDLDNLTREFDTKPRSVVISHAFITTHAPEAKVELNSSANLDGIDTSDSERDISVGGLQNASADLFDGITYVALGHIHGPQKVKAKASKTYLRYSGSLLRYSMSEARHKKSFVILNLGPKDTVDDADIELVEIPQPRGMTQLIDTSDELISGKYLSHKNDFVAVIVTDDKYSTAVQAKMRDYFPYLVSFAHRPNYTANESDLIKSRTSQGISDLDIVKAFFTKVTGKEPTGKELQVIQRIVEEVTVEAGVSE